MIVIQGFLYERPEYYNSFVMALLLGLLVQVPTVLGLAVLRFIAKAATRSCLPRRTLRRNLLPGAARKDVNFPAEEN